MSISKRPRSVTVVTATRGRPELLKSALESVAGQCCDHVARHIVLADDCAETVRAVEVLPPARRTVRLVPRGAGDHTGPRRLGILRDLGAQLAGTRWIAYVDDDNEWLPDHLHSLLETVEQHQLRAAHSWMQVIHRDGRPYTGRLFPWSADAESARTEYERLLRLGVVVAGQNVFRDRGDPGTGPDAVRTVDAGEWLLETDLVREIGFAAEFSEADVRAGLWEDDKFLAALLERKIPFACTDRPTVVYRLGGISTTSMDESLTSEER